MTAKKLPMCPIEQNPVATNVAVRPLQGFRSSRHLSSLRQYLDALRDLGELQEIAHEVDWNLEIGAVTRRCYETGAPGGGDPGPPRHPSSDRGLADLDAKLEQFPVDAGRPPQRVGPAHTADQSTDFCVGLGSSRTA